MRRSSCWAQLLDILAFLADHDTGPGSVDGDHRIAGRPFDLDAAYRSVLEALLDEIPRLEIEIEEISILLGIRIPLRGPVLDDAEADTRWMYFLAHAVLSLTLPVITALRQ